MTNTFITILFFVALSAFAQDGRISYRQQCLEIGQYIVKDSYQLDCNYSYHHYNARSSYQYYQDTSKKIKIGSFNLFNPGNSQTFFKDYNLIAKIIDEFDIVAALELLPIIGEDLDNNQSVLSFIENAPEMIKELEDAIRDADSTSAVVLRARLAQVQTDYQKAAQLYRAPGYYKVLAELRKLDPSWSLLLAPRGQGSATSNVQEMAGFFYRARRVRTITNQYCKEYVTNNIGAPVACIPNFGDSFLGEDYKDVFSRRPFMASFESGNSQFNLLATHVVFSSPISSESMEHILMPTFGVSDYHQLGTGVTKQNYARFAEIQATLTFMRKMRDSYQAKNLILMGDLNIESDNAFWQQLLGRNSGFKLFVEAATSVTMKRYNRDGTPTNGYASNYDHFLYNPKETSSCTGAARYDFYKESISKDIHKRYLVRASKKIDDSYPITDYAKIQQAVDKLEQQLQARKTIKYQQIVWDDYKFDYRLSSFEKRVFLDQSYDKTYYRIYSEIISDHAPIALNCTTK